MVVLCMRVVILFINFYTTDAFGMNTISIYIYIYKNVNVRLLHIKDLGVLNQSL